MMRPLVLVVEDEPALVTLLRYNLEREGFAVNEAHDGEEALLQLRETMPDAVLLDWMLPRISGIEVCRQIRRAPAWRDLPVIMLTARGDEGDRVRGLDSGADDYVVKPFSPGELVARLRACPSRPHRIPPAALFPGAPRPGVLARAAARRGVGPRRRARAAHRRRPHPPAAQGVERRQPPRRYPHGSCCRLRARHRAGIAAALAPAGTGAPSSPAMRRRKG